MRQGHNGRMTPIEEAEKSIKRQGGIWTNDGWVVKGELDLDWLDLTELPKIKSVGGYFDCSYNQFTDLVGSPRTVGGDFWCYNNPLKSLSGLPDKIGGNFVCDNNLTLPKEEIMLLIKAHPKNLKEVVKIIKWI